MADDRRRNPPTGAFPRVGAPAPAPTRPGSAPASGPNRTSTQAVPTSTMSTPRDPRTAVVVPVRYKYESIIDFVETQSVNISKSGMFVLTSEVLAVGTQLDFEVALADGFQLLKGKAEVVRLSSTPPRGLGLRFAKLDEASQKLISRIVEVNEEEGKKPTVSLDFGSSDASRGFSAAPGSGAAGVVWRDQDVSIQLNTVTVSYFVYNPLLNIRLGGFVVPADREVPLGTIFSVTITSPSGESLFAGKGKVVAKHEKRLGIRLTDVDKAVLTRLQGEVNRLVPSK
jgi:uncharacterized protein (TIGR02266 family)